MNISVPVIITQGLDFPINVANRLYGYAEGVIAVGSIAGGLLAGLLAKKLTPKAIRYLTFGCAFPMFVCGLALQFIHSAIIVYIIDG